MSCISKLSSFPTPRMRAKLVFPFIFINIAHRCVVTKFANMRGFAKSSFYVGWSTGQALPSSPPASPTSLAAKKEPPTSPKKGDRSIWRLDEADHCRILVRKKPPLISSARKLRFPSLIFTEFVRGRPYQIWLEDQKFTQVLRAPKKPLLDVAPSTFGFNGQKASC